jgi:hypothetical protein
MGSRLRRPSPARLPGCAYGRAAQRLVHICPRSPVVDELYSLVTGSCGLASRSSHDLLFWFSAVLVTSRDIRRSCALGVPWSWAAGLFVPKPISDGNCQGRGVPDLPGDVRQRPLPSVAGDGGCLTSLLGSYQCSVTPRALTPRRLPRPRTIASASHQPAAPLYELSAATASLRCCTS